MYHDVWPLPALHGMDRCQGDPVKVVWRVQLLEKPGRKPACIAFEIGQLAQRVEIVTVGGDCAVAPLVERRRARVQPALADLGSQHSQDLGSRPAFSRIADLSQVVNEISDLASLAIAALGIEPARQAGQPVHGTLSADKVEKRPAHAALGAPRDVSQHWTRERPIGSGRNCQPCQRGSDAASLKELFAHSSIHGHPVVAKEDLHGGQRRVHTRQDGHIVGWCASIEEVPHPVRSPGSRAVVTRKYRQAPTVTDLGAFR